MVTDIDEIRTLGETIGYGNLMEIASALWKIKLIDSGLSESAASEAAFAPTITPFMLPEYRKQAEKERDAYVSQIRQISVLR